MDAGPIEPWEPPLGAELVCGVDESILCRKAGAIDFSEIPVLKIPVKM